MEMENENLQVPESTFPLTKRDTAFSLCAGIACVFAAVFGICEGYALGYLLSSVAMLAVFVIYFAKDRKRCGLSFFSCLLALANAGVFVCTSNGSVRFFAAAVSFFLTLTCVYGWKNGSVKGNRQTLRIFFRAVATIGKMRMSIRSLSAGKNKRSVGKAMFGVLCALPVLIVVVPLLLSSDFAFQGMMKEVFGNVPEFILKIGFGLLLSLFVIPYGLSMRYTPAKPAREGRFTGIENVFVISFLSAISLFYVLYLVSQLAYFFSAFQGFLPDEKITYAQYARRGFFEMCVIAVINLALVFLTLLLAKKQNGKTCHSIKALATFISVFTLIIIATAISKMVLYIDAYGMTVKRLTTSAFMVFLAIVYISVILRVYTVKANVIKTGLIAAGCIVLLLGIVNVNYVCARYNYESYRSGKLTTVDVEALYHMGYEGIPYIVELASDENQTVAKQAKDYLKSAYLHRYFDGVKATKGFTLEQLQNSEKNPSFARFSIPRKAAYDSLYEYLRQNPDFSDYCKIK